ncbi:lytic transglycosylase domain-containing protein [Paenibacillus sp. DS2015]|uniref:lytic transglycosylase domain-containing protein n=1 Tax=Paenibacillus sp. DS2015 TaxID=3373917 RepID=UPI003D1BE41A
MRLLRKKRVLLLLFLSFVILLFFNTNWMSWFYPISYKEEIIEQAEMYEVDPFLIAAIIRAESNFKPGKESKKGALGIMQLMPDTAKWAMEMAKLPDVSLDRIKHEVRPNIQLGTWYISFLSKQFDNNRTLAIAAYNAGQGNVRSWMDKGLWDGQEETIKEIPIGETRHYVQRVLYYYEKYTDIYDEF